MKKKLNILFILVMLLTGIMATNLSAAEGGFGPCFATLCLGPRVGLEMNEGRKIRTIEWLQLVPIVNSYAYLKQLYEAFSGKTMSEIATAEKL